MCGWDMIKTRLLLKFSNISSKYCSFVWNYWLPIFTEEKSGWYYINEVKKISKIRQRNNVLAAIAQKSQKLYFCGIQAAKSMSWIYIHKEAIHRYWDIFDKVYHVLINFQSYEYVFNTFPLNKIKPLLCYMCYCI